MRKSISFGLIILGAGLAFFILARPVRGSSLLSAGDSYAIHIPVVARQPPAIVSKIDVMQNPLGEKKVVGEVSSLVQSPLFDVVVQLDAYDIHDDIIATFTDTLVMTATLPGQLNVFEVGTGITSTVTFEAYIIKWENSGNNNYHAVTITDYELDPQANGVWVTATVRNDASVVLVDVFGVFWHFSQISPIEPEYIIETLAPGETYIYTTFVDSWSFSVPNAIVQGTLP